jgi:hypothetical protein
MRTSNTNVYAEELDCSSIYDLRGKALSAAAAPAGHEEQLSDASPRRRGSIARCQMKNSLTDSSWRCFETHGVACAALTVVASRRGTQPLVPSGGLSTGMILITHFSG